MGRADGDVEPVSILISEQAELKPNPQWRVQACGGRAGSMVSRGKGRAQGTRGKWGRKILSPNMATKCDLGRTLPENIHVCL